jgi:FtsH-binding integral membrane protein
MLLFWGQNPHAHLDPNAHGAYAFLTHPLPLIYDLLAVSCVLAAVGLFRAAWVRRNQTPTSPSVLLPVFTILIALVGLVFLRFILTFFQAQGRYWYPALLPLAFFYVFGWQSLLPRRASFPAFVCLLSGGLLALNVYTLVALLVPRFS